jgi:hypothetical protein
MPQNQSNAITWDDEVKPGASTVKPGPDGIVWDQDTSLHPTTSDNAIENAGRNAFVTKHPYLAGAARAVSTLGGLIPESAHASDYSVVPGAAHAVAHPIDTAHLVNEGLVQPLLHAGQGRYDKMFGAADEAKKDWQSGHPLKAVNAGANALAYGAEGTVPVIGPAVGGMADELEHGIHNRNTPEGQEEMAHSVGSALTAGAMTNLGGKANETVAKVARPVGEAAGEGVRAVGDKVQTGKDAVAKHIYDPGTEGGLPPSGELRPLAKLGSHIVGAGAGAFGGGEIGAMLSSAAGPNAEILGKVAGAYKGWKSGPDVVRNIFQEPGEFASKRANFDIGEHLRNSMPQGNPTPFKLTSPDTGTEPAIQSNLNFPKSVESAPAAPAVAAPVAARVPSEAATAAQDYLNSLSKAEPPSNPFSTNAATERAVDSITKQATGVPKLKSNIPLKDQLTAKNIEAKPENLESKNIKPEPTEEEARAARHQTYAKWDKVGKAELTQKLMAAGMDVGQRVVTDAKGLGEGAISRKDAIRFLEEKGVKPE